jgi:hypothetical protein
MTLDRFLLTGKTVFITGNGRPTLEAAFGAFWDAGSDVTMRPWESGAEARPGERPIGADVLVHCPGPVPSLAILENELGFVREAGLTLESAGRAQGGVVLVVVELAMEERAAEAAAVEIELAVCELAAALAPDGGRANAIVFGPSVCTFAPEELGGAMLFLTSDASSFLTGQVLCMGRRFAARETGASTRHDVSVCGLH